MRAWVVPPESGAELQLLELADEGSSLRILQEAVGGYVESMPNPFLHDDHVTIYINEDGQAKQLPVNYTAMDLLMPRMGPGALVLGPLVIAGFNPVSGVHRDLPLRKFPAHAKTVLKEAGRWPAGAPE